MKQIQKLLTLPKAILFDHDGTLIDSESIHFDLWNKLLEAYGVKLTESFYNAVMAGVPVPQNAIDVVEQYKLNLDPKLLAKQKIAATVEYLSANTFPLMDGAQEVVKACYEAGFTLAIVTGGTRLSVERTIATYGFEGMFSTIVAVEDVSRSKPAPDCYLKALKQLNINASEAIAIEDTEHGLQAAYRANVNCIVLPTPLTLSHDFSVATARYDGLTQWWETFKLSLIK